MIQSHRERIYYFRLGDQGGLSEKVFKVVSQVTNWGRPSPTLRAKAPGQELV